MLPAKRLSNRACGSAISLAILKIYGNLAETIFV